MIKAISNFKENNTCVKSIKPVNNNFIYTKQFVNNSIKSKDLKQISFNGNLSKVGKKLLGDVDSNFVKKIIKILDEAVISPKRIIRRAKNQDELPFIDDPLVLLAKDKPTVNKEIKVYNDTNPGKVKLDTAKGDSISKKNWKQHWLDEEKRKDAEAAEKKAEAAKAAEKGKHDPKLHHHDPNDFDDNLNNNHHGTTSFRGDGSSIEHSAMDDFAVHGDGTTTFDSVSDAHGLGVDLASEKPNLKGLGSSALEHGTNALNNFSEVAEKHDALAGALDGISNVTEHLDNPALQGVLSEVLPGTKFIQPAIDLKNGKIDKAIVGGATRAGEIALTVFVGPVKLAWAGLGGIAGTISKLAGNKGKGTGFFGGFNAASKMWGKGRESVEDFILDETKADPLALARKQREAYEKGTEQIVNDIKKRADENVSKITDAYRPHIDNAQKAANRANQATQKAAEETVFYQKQSKVVEGQLAIITKAIDVRLQKLQEAQKEMMESHKALINNLSKKLEEAKRQHNTKLQEELNLKLDEMQKAQKAEINEITKDIKDLMQSSNVFEKIHNKGNLKGFNRIAGYQDQINTLLDHFGTPIALERIGKTADVPGGILFFGPQGIGKTTFAEAFAGQLGCELVKITPELDAKTNWSNLEKVAKEAQERFEKDKIRTVILINEFDNFASNDTKNGFKKVFDAISPVGVGDINVKLKKFIEECSAKYHCTVFATTNFPERISSELLGSGEFYKAGLPPANRDNTAAILKHYASDFAESDVNYEELAEQIVKNQQNEAFSNSKIKSVVMDLVKADKNKTRKITQEDLRKSIENKGADISKQDLELFNRQLEHVAKLSKKKSS